MPSSFITHPHRTPLSHVAIRLISWWRVDADDAWFVSP